MSALRFAVRPERDPVEVERDELLDLVRRSLAVLSLGTREASPLVADLRRAVEKAEGR